jgi:hypothetical protein
MGSYLTPEGVVRGNNHDVGERLSWTLRPIVSTKLNLVVFDDGTKEDYPEDRTLPAAGESVKMTEKYVADGRVASREAARSDISRRTEGREDERASRTCAKMVVDLRGGCYRRNSSGGPVGRIVRRRRTDCTLSHL